MSGPLSEHTMNNDPILQLSVVLRQECTRSTVHCQSKKRALEIISELGSQTAKPSDSADLRGIADARENGQYRYWRRYRNPPRKTR